MNSVRSKKNGDLGAGGRLILLPGLGADERMFGRLGDVGVPLLTPRHLVSRRGETLPGFAHRTAEALGVTEADMIGGASFGAVVASAVARLRPVRALVLIGGALDAGGLRPIPGGRMLRSLPPLLLRPLLRSDGVLQRVFAPEGAEIRKLARTMLDEAPTDLLLYGGLMLFGYRSTEPLLSPVFAIHGDRDPVMIPPPVPGCRIVEGAGHCLAWTHPAEVTDFLREVLLAVRPPL